MLRHRMWEPILLKRHGIFAEPSNATKKEYRKRVLDDHRRLVHKFKLPTSRIPSGTDISNDTNLPPAKRSRLAADLQHWCEFNSWGVCNNCGIMLPRSITPQSLTETLPPEVPASKCHHCTATRQYFVPNAKDTPEELQGLEMEHVHALTPLVIHTGPHVRAAGGYRMHTGMIRFSWQSDSVRHLIKEVRSKSQRKKLRKAYDLIGN